jgi:hypothetical protein
VRVRRARLPWPLATGSRHPSNHLLPPAPPTACAAATTARRRARSPPRRTASRSRITAKLPLSQLTATDAAAPRWVH